MGALDLLDLCLVNYKNVRDISLLLHSSLIHFLAAQVLNQRRTLFFVFLKIKRLDVCSVDCSARIQQVRVFAERHLVLVTPNREPGVCIP